MFNVLAQVDCSADGKTCGKCRRKFLLGSPWARYAECGLFGSSLKGDKSGKWLRSRKCLSEEKRLARLE